MEPFWQLSLDDALRAVSSGRDGLSSEEAARRLDANGPNALGRTSRASTLELLLRQFDSPIVLILVFATILAGALGDVTDSLIILAIIAVSGFLGFWQERGATRAVDSLLAVVQLFVLRTRRPFFQSRPSNLLIVSSALVALVTLAIPYTFIGTILDLPPLPAPLLGVLLVIVALYVLATEGAKAVFLRRITASTAPMTAPA